MPTDVLIGLIREGLFVVGGTIAVWVGTWAVITERSKINAGPRGKIIIKLIMVGLAISVSLFFLPEYLSDVAKMDIRTKSGVVEKWKVFPPPFYFIGQSFQFRGEEGPSYYRISFTRFLVVRGKSYRIKYLPRSKQVLTIEEVGTTGEP